MSKKNIDKLFQEKLKDFHEIPENKVWTKISDSLDKKKSRKIIPIWWKLGGVAAVFAALFAIYNTTNTSSEADTIISDFENKEIKNDTKTEDSKEIQFEKPIKEDAIEIVNSTDSDTHRDINSTENNKANTIKKHQELSQTEQIATGETKKAEKSNPTLNKLVKNAPETKYDRKELATNANEKLEQNSKKEELTNSPNKTTNINEAFASSIPKKDQTNDKTIKEQQKKSIFDEIEKQTEAKEEALVEDTSSKWSVGANLAPVYFNSFGEGSSIDPSFNSNSKSGEVNMSYGLKVAYNVSNKLSVRTGLNKVNYGYNTNEIEYSASLQGALSSRLNNVNYTQSAENVVVNNKNQNTASLANKSADVIAKDISRNGVITQDFGYIEVPVELDYNLIDSRLGLNLVGGVSTLFLTNNNLSLNNTEETIELGEANNINNMNFSTNIGFGLNYKFTKKVQLNIEPVFKYQLGTFSDTSGSFNPFSIGVYSGLNFKF